MTYLSAVAGAQTANDRRAPEAVIRALAESLSSVNERRLPRNRSTTDGMAPETSLQARQFPAAEEQGRKAADWVLNRYRHTTGHLVHSNSKKKAKKTDEESLRSLIQRRRTSRAMKMYNRLKEQEIRVSVETQNELLDLLAFYGVGNPWREREGRTKKLKMSKDSKESSESSVLDQECVMWRRVWDPCCRAENFFEEMVEKNAASYEIMIGGMAAFDACDKAMAMYHEMREIGFHPSVTTFNTIIRILSNTRMCGDDHDRKHAIFKILSDMTQSNPPIKPSALTLLALLKACDTFGQNRTDYAMQLMHELTGIGVKPSMACYHALLRIHCAAGKPGVLYTIVKCLEQTPSCLHDISDEEDLHLFELAASVAYTLGDTALSERLFALTQQTAHPPLADVCRFLKSILRNMSRYGSFESFFHHYCLVVPTLFLPEPSTYVNFLVTCRNKGKSVAAVRLWKDIVRAGLDVSGLISVSLLGVCSQVPDDVDKENVFHCIQSILSHSETVQVIPSRNGVGAVLNVYMKTKPLDEVMVFFRECQHKQWVVSYTAAIEFLEMCIKDGHVDSSLEVINAMAGDKQVVKDEHFQALSRQGTLTHKQMEDMEVLWRRMTVLQRKRTQQKRSEQP